MWDFDPEDAYYDAAKEEEKRLLEKYPGLSWEEIYLAKLDKEPEMQQLGLTNRDFM